MQFGRLLLCHAVDCAQPPEDGPVLVVELPQRERSVEAEPEAAKVEHDQRDDARGAQSREAERASPCG